LLKDGLKYRAAKESTEREVSEVGEKGRISSG
jgi:hypothetical protein